MSPRAVEFSDNDSLTTCGVSADEDPARINSLIKHIAIGGNHGINAPWIGPLRRKS